MFSFGLLIICDFKTYELSQMSLRKKKDRTVPIETKSRVKSRATGFFLIYGGMADVTALVEVSLDRWHGSGPFKVVLMIDR